MSRWIDPAPRPRSLQTAFTACLLLILAALPARAQGIDATAPPPPPLPRTESWWNGFSGHGDFESPVVALCSYQGEVIALGDFQNVPNGGAGSTAAFDGTAWRPLDSLRSRWPSHVLTLCNGELWAGGEGFWYLGAEAATPIGSLIRWTGSYWHGFYLFAAPVYAICGYDGAIVAAGNFVHAGMNRIGRLDGTVWTALGDGFNGPVRAVTAYGGSLIAAGDFTASGALPLDRIARWDGAAWHSLGAGFDGPVYSLGVHEGKLVAGGLFSHSGPISFLGVASWDGNSWSPMGAGLNSPPKAFLSTDEGLLACGEFTQSGEAVVRYVARFADGQWSPLGAGPEQYCRGLAQAGGDLYAAVGPTVRRWDGIRWEGLGTGLSGEVYSLSPGSGDVIVGGAFERAGSQSADYIARWTGTDFESIGSGLPSLVFTTAISHEKLIAGGTFDIDVDGAGGIASFNGSLWTEIGGGVGGMNWLVGALEVADSAFVAGGNFSNAGGVPAANIAQWDGASWSALGAGTNGRVRSLLRHDGELYAGGDFTTAGGLSARSVARWDGTAWSPLGSGTNGSIMTLVEYEGDLIAGGTFTQAGGVAASSVARWDGSVWSPLGTGVDGLVWALVEHQGALIATGSFETAGGVPVANLARWDGAAWLPIGGGLNDRGRAVLSTASGLLLGGAFTLAGDQMSQRMALWFDPSASVPEQIFPGAGVRVVSAWPNPFRDGVNFELSLSRSAWTRVDVFDPAGRLCARLLNRALDGGGHHVSWDGVSMRGTSVSPGVYFVRAQAGGETACRKVIRIER